jgi:hypothetical protein
MIFGFYKVFQTENAIVFSVHIVSQKENAMVLG